MEAPKLRRGPFGYTRRSVRLVLADRDGSLVKAEDRARAAEAQVIDVRSEAERLRTQLADRAEPLRVRVEGVEARIEVLEAEVRSLRPELEAGLGAAVADLEAARAAVEEAAERPSLDLSTRSEGAPVVPEAAGSTMVRTNGAGTPAAEEPGEAERARRETMAEIERLMAYRDRLASLVGVVRSTVEDAMERADGLGDRVDEAVAPLTEAIAKLGDPLAAFAELAALPGEDTREPTSEPSLDPIELEGPDGPAGQPDPAGGVGAGTSHEPRTEEAPEPVTEGIVPAAIR